VFANGHFEGLVRAAGLPYVELGTAEEYKKSIENPDLWHPRRGMAVVFGEGVVPALEPAIASLRARLRPDTILVGGTLALGARVVQEIDGVPLATIQLAPTAFRTVHRMPKFAGIAMPLWAPRWWKRFVWRMGDRLIDPLVLPRLEAARKPFGLPRIDHAFTWAESPDLIVGMFPDWFGPPQPDWPRHAVLTGFPLYDGGDRRPAAPHIDKWLDAGDPPIVFTAGSANVGAAPFFGAAVEVSRQLGRRALLVTARRASVPDDLSDDVRWESYVPFGTVLPRAAALVSHGGIGTVAHGVAAGIPQLTAPLSFDQFDNASRLEDLGCGLTLPHARFTASRAAAAFDRLLGSPGFAARARTLPARLPKDPLGDTAALLEKLSAERTPVRAV
jgi:UDP:flavonoid glycosyltransferase YjiC (YdhE family)